MTTTTSTTSTATPTGKPSGQAAGKPAPDGLPAQLAYLTRSSRPRPSPRTGNSWPPRPAKQTGHTRNTSPRYWLVRSPTAKPPGTPCVSAPPISRR